MTENDFRNDPALRDGLSKVIQNPALQTALAVVKSKHESLKIPIGLSGIDCALALAERQTRCAFVDELLSLTQTIPDEDESRPPVTFGTAHTEADFDEANEQTP